jgi:hypothetical protein
MMKHSALRFTIAALLLLLVACHKEGSGRVELVLEPLNNANVKLAVVNDVDAVWCNGDKINFNGSVVAITREDETHAYISNVYSQSVNSACFPATLATTDLGGNTVGVLLPSAYHYRRDGSGRQLVELPMVARAADGDPLQFCHLTAALCITLSNDRTDSKTLVIDSLTVSSNNYLLCGPCSADMTGAEPLGAQALGEGTSTVTLFFDRERLELAPGDSRKVMVPVAPVGDGNKFTISVATRCQGTRYNYSRTQTTGGALPRNMLAYASMTLNNTPVNTRAVFEGEGSLGYPFLIKNTVDLIALTELCDGTTRPYYPTSITFSSSCYKITNDINMAGISVSPIASYTGNTFDGNNKTISNLTITDTVIGSDVLCGLFASVQTSTVQNLKVANVTLQSSKVTKPLRIGAIAGKIAGATLTNCDVEGITYLITNLHTQVYYGGLVGTASNSNTLTNCDVDYTGVVSISSSNTYYGGLVGNCEKVTSNSMTMTGCTVANSSFALSTTGNLWAGGMVGYLVSYALTLNNCQWSGSMSFSNEGPTTNVGKMIGYYAKGSGGSLTIGAVTSDSGTVTANGSSCTQNVGNNPSY